MANNLNKLFMCLGIATLAFNSPNLALAQNQIETPKAVWPSSNYDPSIPTIKSVLGYEIGQRISSPAQIITYFEALEVAAPDRIIIKDYGKTWQGRRLIYAVIGTKEQLQNLETIRANSIALSDPRKTGQGQANLIIANQPTIVWLANSVHGDEISPADSAMMTAYHLLASRPDSNIDAIRKNTLTVIVPVQNPDGRDRFIASNRSAEGLEPDADELSAERDQPWPGGRMNHYNFDLNRDWISLTQPETQGHIKAYLDWYPQVMIDAHEMGREGNFFFPPEADPINPNHTAGQRQLRAIFGANNARWFDNYGISYFTREIYDGFYPGYGDGWPATHGTIAMTYEQASSRGLVARGKDGKILTYETSVRNHFVAALATIETAANERKRILENFYDFRKSAVQEGQNGSVKSYIINISPDSTGAHRLASLLAKQGIEVEKAKATFSACGVNYQNGAYIVRSAQPAQRLVKNLLEKEIPLEPDFVAKQLNLRERGLDDEIYDVTAWSLPLLYNIDAKPCNIIPVVSSEALIATEKWIAQSTKPNPQYGFIIPSLNSGHAKFGALALKENIKIRAPEEAFTHGGKNYPSGSFVVIKSENGADIDNKIAQISKQTTVDIIGIDDSWVSSGPSFGSIKSVPLKLPRIAIAWDNPTDPYSAGNLRYIAEQRIGFNVTPIRTSRIRANGIGRFDVLILPDTNAGYLTTLGDDGTNNLRAFTQNGGTIVGIGSAVRYLTAPSVDLLASRRENAAKSDDAPKTPSSSEATSSGTIIENKQALTRTINTEGGEPTIIDGAILKVETTENHWLNIGIKPTLYTMYQGSDIFRPLTRNQGVNPIIYSEASELVASGVVWEKNRKQLALKPFAMVQQRGRGFVIGITADISYRAHIEGLDELLFNAIVQSTARANPNR